MSEVALFDLDHTVYEGLSCMDTMQIQAQAGLIPADTVQRAATILHRYREAALEFDIALAAVLRNYAQALAGQSYTRIRRITNAQLARTPDKFSAFVRPAIELLKPGHETILVTAQPDFIAAAAAGALGMKHVATTFEIIGDTFTGQVKYGLFSGARRAQAARRASSSSYDRAGSFAFADSEGDLQLLETVEHPICIDPTPELQRIAEQKEWHIAERATAPSLLEDLLIDH